MRPDRREKTIWNKSVHVEMRGNERGDERGDEREREGTRGDEREREAPKAAERGRAAFLTCYMDRPGTTGDDVASSVHKIARGQGLVVLLVMGLYVSI